MKLKSKKIIMLKPSEIISSALCPRTTFDAYELNSLSESIKANGILEPLLIRKNSDKVYELIAGERRLRAAMAVGIKRVPCVLCEADSCQSALIALTKNIQRCNLSFFEEAEAIENVIKNFGVDRVTLCDSLGIAQSTLSNKLKLLRLDLEFRERIIKSALTERHVRALLCLENDRLSSALDFIVANSLSAKETENYVDKLINGEILNEEKTPVRKRAVGDFRLFTNSIQKLVNSMQDSGIQATLKQKESTTHVEYIIKINKISIENKNAPLQMRIC